MCCAFIACVAGAVAQNVTVGRSGGLFGVWKNSGIVAGSSMSKAPQRAATLDGTELWGYHMGGLDEISGLGVSSAATYWAGYFVSGSGMMKGCSINGVNLPFSSTSQLKDVKIWISKDLNTNLYTQDVAVESLTPYGYTAVALDEPFDMPEEGVYVGVQFTVSSIATNDDKFPVMCNNDIKDFERALILKTTVAGANTWGDYTASYGAFGMQLFIGGLQRPERDAYLLSVTGRVSLSGAEVTAPAMVLSNGSEDISSIDYTVEINGSRTPGHYELATPVKGGFNRIFQIDITFTAPEECKGYEAMVSIDKINGKDNLESDKSVEMSGQVVSRIVPRKTIVEEFTGTGCGNCPRGWLGMELLKEHEPNFIGVALHLYNSTDPMYLADYYRYDRLGLSGAPSCTIDRKLRGIDPYYGTENGIDVDFVKYNSELPDVAVDVIGGFNEDSTAVNVRSDIEYLMDGGKYSVAYVLTADGLSGTTSAWKQENYYYRYTAANVGNDPLMMQFCNGGKYGQSSVFLTYNDVMVGSSYSTIRTNIFTGTITSGGENQASELTGYGTAGNRETNGYVLQMPTKAVLKAALNTDELYVVAIVTAEDGTVSNAARAKVMSYEDYKATGIAAVKESAPKAVEVARYSLNGARLTAPQKGVNIVKMSDGQTRKVVVK